MAARTAGATEPNYPRRFELPDGSPPEATDLVTQCNHILDISSSLVQPSEPLDSRWSEGWTRLEGKLDSLEANLREYNLAD